MSHLPGAFALTKAFERATTWMAELATHGPDVRLTAHLKTAHEAAELAEHPDDIEEWADVYICLAGVAAKNGWTFCDLSNAVDMKMSKNELRTWFQKPDGTWQHNPTAEQSPQPAPARDTFEMVDSCDEAGHVPGPHKHVVFNARCAHGMPKRYACHACDFGTGAGTPDPKQKVTS